MDSSSVPWRGLSPPESPARVPQEEKGSLCHPSGRQVMCPRAPVSGTNPQCYKGAREVGGVHKEHPPSSNVPEQDGPDHTQNDCPF